MSIFVSYSSKDLVSVARIVNELNIAGHQVWWDQALPPAERWQDNLMTQLHGADVVVVVLSPNSVQSEWVKKEYRYALEQFESHGKPKVVMVQIVECDLPAEIADFQIINMTDYPDSMWGMTGLIKSVAVDEDILAHRVDLGDGEIDQQLFDSAPAWQQHIENEIQHSRYISRSSMTLSTRCNLSVSEVTRYCLDSGQILLSPYLTPSAQPIPYFGSRRRLMKRYKGDYGHYLGAIRAFFTLIEGKKPHWEYVQCWRMIKAHYVKQWQNEAFCHHPGIEHTEMLFEEHESLTLFIVADKLKDWHLVVEDSYQPLIKLGIEQFRDYPAYKLRAALFAATNVYIDGDVDKDIINFVLGLLEGQRLVDRKVKVIGRDFSAKSRPEGIFSLSGGVFASPERLFADLI